MVASSTSPLTNEGRLSEGLKQSFFSRYGTLPGEEAYYGMDVMRLVSQLLSKSGTLITEGLNSIDDQGNYRFDFVAVFAAELFGGCVDARLATVASSVVLCVARCVLDGRLPMLLSSACAACAVR